MTREEASERLGKFLQRLKQEEYTIAVVGSVGAIPAMASFLLLLELLEPYKDLIDSIRTASGSGIPGALFASGVATRTTREHLLSLSTEDVVEDIGLFAEYSEGKNMREQFRAMKAYYTAAYRAGTNIGNHLLDNRRGIVKGDKIEELLRTNLLSNRFEHTHPALEVVATRFFPPLEMPSGELVALPLVVFSHNTTPDAPISQTVTASCAMRQIMKPRIIDSMGDVLFVDAAQKESIPLQSVLDDYERKGKNPEKFFILGSFVHTLPSAPEAFHQLAVSSFFDRDTYKTFFEHGERVLRYAKTPHLIFEFNAAKVELPPAEPFPDFPELGIGFRKLRKMFARFTQHSMIEKYLHGVAHFIYRELNMRHFSKYLYEFEPKLYDKVARHVPELERTIFNGKK